MLQMNIVYECSKKSSVNFVQKFKSERVYTFSVKIYILYRKFIPLHPNEAGSKRGPRNRIYYQKQIM